MDDKEIVFSINRIEDIADIPQTDEIRRLSTDDRAVFNRHLGLCRQARDGVTGEEWRRWNAEGVEFYMLFAGAVPVTRCSIEKYSEEKWEASDVRTVREYRGRACAGDRRPCHAIDPGAGQDGYLPDAAGKRRHAAGHRGCGIPEIEGKRAGMV